MKKSTKDNIVGAGVSAFTGTLAAMIAYGLECTSLVIGIASAVVGAAIGAAFKEWRRPDSEKRPKKFVLPYLAGAAVSAGLAAGMYALI